MKCNAKRAAALLAAAVMTVSLCLPVSASEGTLYIYSAEDLLGFKQRCIDDSYSRGLTVILRADIDLSGYGFTPIPIFCGSFDGQGHSITGLTIDTRGSEAGLFRYLTESAAVKNLALSGEISPQGSASSVGVLVGENSGRIENCTVGGRVSGSENIGGVVGLNTASGVITGCVSSAEVRGTLCVGGIAGFNEGLIQDSSNTGAINCHNDESFSDVGGIAGRSTGQIEACSSSGDAGYIHNGYNVGGIVGIQSGVTLDCTNSGTVHGRKDVGGVAGQLEPSVDMLYGEGILDRLDVEFAAFTQLLRDILNQIGDSSKDAAESITEFIDLTDAAGGTLSSSIENAVRTAQRAIDDLAVQSDRVTAAVDVLLKDIDTLSEKLNTYTSDALIAISDIRGSLSSGLADADDAARSAGDEILRQLSSIEAELDGFERAMRNASTAANNLELMFQGILAVLADSSMSPAEMLTAISDIYTNAGDMDILTHLASAVQAAGNALDGLPGLVRSIADAYTSVSDELGDMLDRVDKAAGRLGGALTSLNGSIKSFSDGATGELGIINDALDLTGEILNRSLTEVGAQISDMSEVLDGQTQSIHDKIDAMADGFTQSGDELHTTADGMLDRLDAIREIITQTDSPEYTVEDISAQNISMLSNGVVSGCENHGAVTGDINTGGIVGLVSYELLEDPEEDIELPEKLLVDTTAQIRAVVLGCQNSGAVTTKNDYAGGIIGHGYLGAVIGCVNTGDVETENGNYCGGIAGRSRGVISGSHAQCLLTGNDYIGGIAGEGRDISGCYTMVDISSEGERLGAIAGYAAEVGQTGNYFILEGLGGIDGINYEDRAKALGYDEFILLESLPQSFLEFGVTFVADSEIVASFSLGYGESFDTALTPECPQSNGLDRRWEAFYTGGIRRNIVVYAEESPLRKTISTGESVPIMLAEGSFSDDAALSAKDWSAGDGALPKGYSALGGYTYEIVNAPIGEAVTLRVYADSGEEIALWSETGLDVIDSRRDGSYLVFEAPVSGSFMIVSADTNHTAVIATLIAALLVCAVIVLLRRGKKRGGSGGAPQETEEAAHMTAAGRK